MLDKIWAYRASGICGKHFWCQYGSGKINFQGNKIFRDNKLRNVIKSEEGKFWKFITSNKYLDENKIKNDEILLKKYYKNKGYFNVKIKSSYAKNINNEFFELNNQISSLKYKNTFHEIEFF